MVNLNPKPETRTPLSGILGKMANLEKLHAGCNGMGDTGADHLGVALEKLERVLSLNLKENSFGPASGGFLEIFGFVFLIYFFGFVFMVPIFLPISDSLSTLLILIP